MQGADENGPPVETWPWIGLLWWFFGIVGYHLFVAHRLHVTAALPYALVTASAIVVALVARRRFVRSRPIR